MENNEPATRSSPYQTQGSLHATHAAGSSVEQQWEVQRRGLAQREVQSQCRSDYIRRVLANLELLACAKQRSFVQVSSDPVYVAWQAELSVRTTRLAWSRTGKASSPSQQSSSTSFDGLTGCLSRCNSAASPFGRPWRCSSATCSAIVVLAAARRSKAREPIAEENVHISGEEPSAS